MSHDIVIDQIILYINNDIGLTCYSFYVYLCNTLKYYILNKKSFDFYDLFLYRKYDKKLYSIKMNKIIKSIPKHDKMLCLLYLQESNLLNIYPYIKISKKIKFSISDYYLIAKHYPLNFIKDNAYHFYLPKVCLNYIKKNILIYNSFKNISSLNGKIYFQLFTINYWLNNDITNYMLYLMKICMELLDINAITYIRYLSEHEYLSSNQKIIFNAFYKEGISDLEILNKIYHANIYPYYPLYSDKRIFFYFNNNQLYIHIDNMNRLLSSFYIENIIDKINSYNIYLKYKM